MTGFKSSGIPIICIVVSILAIRECSSEKKRFISMEARLAALESANAPELPPDYGPPPTPTSKPYFMFTTYFPEKKRYGTFHYEYGNGGTVRVKALKGDLWTTLLPPFTMEQQWAQADRDQ